ncbi:hypothetical protein BHE74_00023781 [Ensete ventricosum]|nr:hypothetical protein BHE74_00023781 [Ensete ventricosum]
MEGWLQLVRCNRLGLHYTRKRYFVLEGNALNCYKGVPASDREVLGAPPPRIPPLISWFFLSYSFRLFRSRKERNMRFCLIRLDKEREIERDFLAIILILQLGARSSEEAARWIKNILDAAFMVEPQEREESHALHRWDFCLLEGNVVESLDEHTDIIHKKLRGDWLPWLDMFYHELINTFLKFRTVILYHSVIHYKCQPERGYVRACLKSNVKANTTLMQMVAADWMKSDKREDNLGSRTGGIVQLIRCLNVNIQLAIDVGSSSIAKGVVSLVVGYLNSLVIEMAFLIQGDTQEELPEVLLGTCRLNHLDISQAVWISSW